MYLLKGFVTFPSFIKNDIGVVSPIGEVSKDSLTYAKEVGVYSNQSISDITLYSFLSEDNESPVVVNDYYRDLAINVSKTIYEASLLQQLINDVDSVRSLVELKHGDFIRDISYGRMVTDGNYWVPEYIQFTDMVNGGLVKLWLSDPSFSIQYDEFEFLFVGPVPTLDDLFDSVANVRVLLSNNGISTILERVNTLVDKNPYTVLRTEAFKWVNNLDTTETLDTFWSIVVYGRRGNNLDLIKPKLVQWILDNSTHNKDEWINLIPDIFKVSEFTIIPFWHIFAIPNRTIQSGINSPLSSLNDVDEVLTVLETVEGYDPVSVRPNTMVTTAPIRNLALLISGNAFNRDEISIIDKIIPDYISVDVNTIDFTRMEAPTQEWVQMLIGLLIAADTATLTNVTAPDYQSVIRDDILYVSKVFNDITYLMAGRESIVQRFGLRGPGYLEIDPDSGCSIEEAIYEDHIQRGGNIHYTVPSDIGLSNMTETTNLFTLDALANELALIANP